MKRGMGKSTTSRLECLNLAEWTQKNSLTKLDAITCNGQQRELGCYSRGKHSKP